MNELAIQKIVADAVNKAGGKSFKMNNRFLIGVADLYVKLPGYEVALVEVKADDAPKRAAATTVAITIQQWRFLSSLTRAKAPCGVLSVLVRPRKNQNVKPPLGFLTLNLNRFADVTCVTLVDDYHWIDSPYDEGILHVLQHADYWPIV